MRTSPLIAACLSLAILGAAVAQEQPQISDRDMALGFYQPIAEQGEPYAQLTMGEIYRDGAGVPKDPIQAYAWFYVAAQQGLDEAEENAAQLWEDMLPNERYQAEALGRDDQSTSKKNTGAGRFSAPPHGGAGRNPGADQ